MAQLKLLEDTSGKSGHTNPPETAVWNGQILFRGPPMNRWAFSLKEATQTKSPGRPAKPAQPSSRRGTLYAPELTHLAGSTTQSLPLYERT